MSELPEPGLAVGPDAPVSITVCPDGPLLVRGAYELRSADGSVVPNDRAVVALCRCGRSRVKPLCDGSHRAARFLDQADAEAMAYAVRNARPLPRRSPAEN